MVGMGRKQRLRAARKELQALEGEEEGFLPQGLTATQSKVSLAESCRCPKNACTPALSHMAVRACKAEIQLWKFMGIGAVVEQVRHALGRTTPE